MKTFFDIFALFLTIYTSVAFGAEAGVSERVTDAKTSAVLKPDTTKTSKILSDNAEESTSVAALVNGVAITEEKVQAIIEKALRGLRGQIPPQLLEQHLDKMRKDAMERLIAEQLLDEQIKKKNITVSDKEVNEQISQIAMQQKLTVNDLKALLEAYGKNLDELKEQIRQGTSYEKLIDIETGGKINVTQQEAQNYYEANTEQFKTPERISASHILVSTRPTEPNSDPAKLKADAKAKAESLLKQIQNGADFAELARTHSDCPSAKDGGKLGTFSKGEMVPEFEKVALTLDVGKVSGITETSYGYHIIKVTDRKKATLVSFEELKDGIIQSLKGKKQEEFIAEYIETLKAKATIVYSEKSSPAQPNQTPKPSKKPAMKKK